MFGALGFYDTDYFYGAPIVRHHLMSGYNSCGVFVITLIDKNRRISGDIKCLIVLEPNRLKQWYLCLGFDYQRIRLSKSWSYMNNPDLNKSDMAPNAHQKSGLIGNAFLSITGFYGKMRSLGFTCSRLPDAKFSIVAFLLENQNLCKLWITFIYHQSKTCSTKSNIHHQIIKSPFIIVIIIIITIHHHCHHHHHFRHSLFHH